MTTQVSKAGPRWREHFRYRRKLLTNQRKHFLELAAMETRAKGKPNGRTSRRLKHTEEEIHAYNSLAEECGEPLIR